MVCLMHPFVFLVGGDDWEGLQVRVKFQLKLGIIGNYWELLAIIGNYWELLAIIGNYWQLLGCKVFPPGLADG